MLGGAFPETLAEARAGAPRGLAALYRDLYPPVAAYLAARVPDEADDLAADVFVAVAEGLGRFEGGETAFRSWVFTIAHRRIVDTRRRRARRRTEPAPVDVLVAHGPAGNAEDDAVRSIALRSAIGLIASLPPDQAEVLLLRVTGGLSVAEVADVVGKRRDAVRALQYRALQRLARDVALADAAVSA